MTVELTRDELILIDDALWNMTGDVVDDLDAREDKPEGYFLDVFKAARKKIEGVLHEREVQ